MKSFLTFLMLFVVTLSFAQTTSTKYTYIDYDGNTYELADSKLKYTPKTGVVKTKELSTTDNDQFVALFKAAIDAKADRTTTLQQGGGSIKHFVVGKEVKINLSAASVARRALYTALVEKMN